MYPLYPITNQASYLLKTQDSDLLTLSIIDKASVTDKTRFTLLLKPYTGKLSVNELE